MRRIGALLSFVLAALLIIVGIVYFFTGSFEMYPTQEQMESARIGGFVHHLDGNNIRCMWQVTGKT